MLALEQFNAFPLLRIEQRSGRDESVALCSLVWPAHVAPGPCSHVLQPSALQHYSTILHAQPFWIQMTYILQISTL